MSTLLARRSFLKAAVSTIACLPAFSALGCASEPAPGAAVRFRDGGSRAALVMESFFDDHELDAAALIGQRYLAAVAPNASETEQVALVAPTRDLLLSAATEEAALEALHAKILGDFDVNATEAVDGWLFSVTELQLCLLVWMMLT